MDAAPKKALKDIQVNAGELGTKDLDEALDLVESGLDATTAALADGTVNWRDLPKFTPVISKIKPAIEGINNVWPEVKDLDQAEMTHVVDRMGVILVKATALFGSAGG